MNWKKYRTAATAILAGILILGGTQFAAADTEGAPDGVTDSDWQSALGTFETQYGEGDKATLEALKSVEVTPMATWDVCNNDVTYILGNNRFGDVPGYGLYDPTCYLESGKTGQGVRALQKALKHCYGKNVSVDGDFGPATRTALIQAQSTMGVTADGVYGQNTRNAMLFPRTDGAGAYTSVCYRFSYLNQFPKNNI